MNIDNKSVTKDQVVLADDATTLANATYDHDGDPNTNGLAATFACGSSDPLMCSLEIVGGELVTLRGYVVDVSVAAGVELTAAVEAVPDATYLTFGVWMQEATNGGDPDFGAFAAGASMVDGDTYGGAAVTGTATYTGSAAGVYTAGSSVDYFQGDATLMANFGEAPETGDDDDLGTITGRIHNIVAGGVAMSDVINLNTDDTATDGNISATGAISGNARMGTGATVDDETTYPYNGDWSAQFYNGTADDTDTTDVDESDVAPGSVAGTFGVTGTMGTGAAAVTRSYLGAFGAHKDD